MNFLELVEKRRSCRKYVTRPVSDESIERCLQATRLAPSACNSQPWRFIVVKETALKNKVADVAFSGMYKVCAFAKQAPVLVVVVRERSRYMAALGGALRGVQFSLIDIGIACEHFILQAAEDNLGTCWIGWFNEKAVKKVLGLSRGEKVDIIISLGYPEDTLQEVKTRKLFSEISEVR